MSLLMLCPSRGRPKAAVDLLHHFEETTTLDDTELLFIVDSDDETAGDYPTDCTTVLHPPPGNMNNALNTVAVEVAGKYDYLGFWGDDHRPRTPAWDELFTEQLRKVGGGMVYGNDLFQGERLPTHIVMTAKIIQKLGWFGLPGAHHLYLDNTWLSLGDTVGCLYYMPSVVIEHVHPLAGKTEWDAGYSRVNTQENYNHDEAVYQTWLAGPAFPRAVEATKLAL